MTTAALELQNVTSGYGRSTILRDVSLTVASGGVTALLGANGAGKTTTLSTASGLIRPQRGKVVLDGADVTLLPPNRRSRLGLCHIPEGRAIFRSLTVRENLYLQAPAGVEFAADEAIEAFRVLGARLNQIAGTLSGGEQQMLALARAFVHSPRVILVDEASLGLAPLVVEDIFEFLAGLKRKGASLLIVDQFVTRALSLADRVYVMNLGEIVFEGAPRELEHDDVFERYLGTAQVDKGG
jgi:branched-chain amino acid transport system ATP-binding protein